ncbi:hypothetical protein P43SY_004489 [Pythium insidiosum]|uniref:GST N-terminal domain-containing protein n=1 Tax=Pythium insidiosum TaxID=114742 RepID=A0AAD5LTR5_PYTIN|nr:hypothetical protein P43SY_004489 [Pythium insidiosum]
MATTRLKLFVYDFCPFCSRVRTLLGLKRIDYELAFLAFDDEATPIGLVGSKQAPILVRPTGEAMAESMDIVRFIDGNLGDDPLLRPSAERAELENWIKASSSDFSALVMPRFVRAPLPEFARRSSRTYFIEKKEKLLGPFPDALARTPELIAKTNAWLEQLESMLESDVAVSGDAVSYDDIDLFPRLRNLTIVKGITWPPKVRAYVDRYAEEADLRPFDGAAQ